MKVKMLVQTNYDGNLREKDTEHEIEESVAQRWIANGIAESKAIDVEFTEVPEVIYDDMTAKQLYKLCVEKDLDVVAKESKEYYIEKLDESNIAAEDSAVEE